mmetsp:Transcript_3584/g.9496  ORF Transcript_3584/g.9496 Transcript_3584/m.9496 type:complete len:245 (-) Transcript_3584:265-999(-)
MMRSATFFSVWMVLLPTSSHAFTARIPTLMPSLSQSSLLSPSPSDSSATTAAPPTARTSTVLFVRKDEQRKRKRVSEDLEPLCYVEFPSPQQRMELKKIATKRNNQRKLQRFFLPAEETAGPFSPQTFADLMALLDDNELVEVRGISKESKSNAFSTAERLVAELKMEYEALPSAPDGEKIIALLSPKGHSVVLYAEMADDHPDAASRKIVLRTSVGQKNVWVQRPKPERDNRGQIISEARTES